MLPILMGILGPLLGKVVDAVGSKFGVDMDNDDIKTKKLELELELQKMVAEQAKIAAQADMKQIEVNMEEAQNQNLFVSGWRPFVGWVCSAAMAYHFILQPVIIFGAAMVNHKIDLPVFDMDSLMTVLLGLLGLGAMRSYEKVRGQVLR